LFFCFIFFYLEKNVFLLVPKYRIGFPFEKNVTKSIVTYDLAQNQNTKKILDISNFKCFPHTIFLNVFYFLISCKVSQIHYLGCDFTEGNALITKDNIGVSDFSNMKIYLWVNRLKKLSKNYFINIKDIGK
jgi:hypothetical protein